MELTREQRFDDLLTEVHVPLQRYLGRRTPEAEDVLADTLVVLWRRLDDVPADRLPWAYGVARGCLANASRAERRRFRLLRRLALEPAAPAPPEDPALAEALAALPVADQEVLRLWAWEQLAPREIAVVLGITPNAASIRLHRATTKLRTVLVGKEGPAPGHQQVDGHREGTHS
ncbi:MAG: RNA polymerase sigma factor [Mycobacteriales bacterium]